VILFLAPLLQLAAAVVVLQVQTELEPPEVLAAAVVTIVAALTLVALALQIKDTQAAHPFKRRVKRLVAAEVVLVQLVKTLPLALVARAVTAVMAFLQILLVLL
jgi:hypothetical protein